MIRSFIAIDDPIHGLAREITRRVWLDTFVFPDGRKAILYRFQESDLPEAYYALAMLHSVGGMRLDALPGAGWRMEDHQKPGVAERVGCFDLVKLDRRSCRDLRLKPSGHPSAMLSAEIIAFGTGMLRARNDDIDDSYQRYLRSEHGRLELLEETLFARIRTLHPLSGLASVGKETFDSTNAIYGDSLGELEQLWDRRADIGFLDLVAESLQGLRGTGRLAATSHPPLDTRALLRLHLQRQAIWKAPPKSGRALLRRIEAILENTRIVRPLDQSGPATLSDPPRFSRD